MKNYTRISLVALFVYIVTFINAQAPQKFSYQAVVRNSANALVVNSPVSAKVSILQGSATGATVYVETHTVTSNANGLITFMIGGGTVSTGTFNTIAWGTAGPFFIQLETDPAGGSNYSIAGTTQLLSVPYALYAETANNPGPAGPAGPAGPQGAQGVQGPQGATGVNNVVGWSGFVGAITTSTGNYVFAGPTAVITITSTSQKVIACASAPLGYNNAGTGSANVGMCYQLGTGTITNFVGGGYSVHNFTNERRCYSATAMVTNLTPGTYTIGLGIVNWGAQSINNNDYVNGWVMVTQ